MVLDKLLVCLLSGPFREPEGVLFFQYQECRVLFPRLPLTESRVPLGKLKHSNG